MRLLDPLLRRRRLAGIALVLALLGTTTGATHAATLPPGPTTTVPAPSPVDPYAAYVPQTTCDPTAKPGAQAVLAFVLEHYGVGRNTGITRACSIGGTSEHKEGRAFDWGVNVNNPAEKAAGDAFTTWLTAPGPDDQPGYNARRLGVMYVIWNKRIWTASTASNGWRDYYGASPHTDHVHVSFGWNGAYMRTSWWTGSLVAQKPIGAVEAVTTTSSDLTVTGWALDPDTSRSTEVHVYVDGVGRAVRADRPRPDIAALYGRGADHGFSVTIPQTPGPHSVCTYAIDSDPVGNTLLGCYSVVVQDAVPLGALESVTSTRTSISLTGWALDPDTTKPTSVHVYVDGVGVAVRADRSRPDIGRLFGKGDAHGFAHTVAVSPGPHDVCVHAINTGSGPHTLLQCRTVVAQDPPTAPPIGSLEAVTASATGITVSGWTVDPDTTAPTDVHLYVDGVGVALRADAPRPDVAAALGRGDRHGFTWSRPLPTGPHTVCGYAMNTGAGAHTALGCRTVVVQDSPAIGAVEALTATATSLSVVGWALDPDTSEPTDVHVYVDGVGAAVRADRSRPDIARVHGRGDRHGFGHTVTVTPGRHDVCVYAINTGPAPHTLLGCRSVVAEPPPTAAPTGSLEAVTASPAGLTISGWTVDPDTTDPTDVHLYVDGVGVSVRADGPRPDVGAALRKGDRHGFTYTARVAPGPHSVCAYAINTGPGPHTLLGCRDATVAANRPPVGAVEAVVPSAGAVTVSGWVVDPDTTEPTAAHVYVGAAGTAVRADLPRPDVAAALGRGDRHGFSTTRTVPPGRHEVCVYGMDATGTDHRLLACRTVVVPA